MKITLTHDFRHTALNQLWRLISGPTILILIPIYLSVVTQGYWFTFISLAALAVFADLGFTTIILQFSAHEFAYLHFDDSKKLVGDLYYFNRISSLFRFALHWSIKISLIAFPIILFIGYYVLSQKQADIQWLLPWIIYSLGSVLTFVNNVVLSFIEGCNSVGNVQRIRLSIAMVNAIIIMFGLIGHLELFTLAISLVGSASIGTAIILHEYGVMLKQLYNVDLADRYEWQKDILPLLGKYAISWMSGYFIFSIFTPIAFHYYGAAEAGKVGLSMSLWTAVFGISNLWMTILMPKINILVAKKEYAVLNYSFYRHLKLSIGTYMLGAMIIFVLYFFLDGRYEIINRFVSPLSLLFVGLCWLFQVIINALAIYMRAHKEEPLVLPSLLSGIYIASTTWFIALHLSFDYFFLGFLSSFIWGLPWILKIFRKYKNRGMS